MLPFMLPILIEALKYLKKNQVFNLEKSNRLLSLDEVNEAISLLFYCYEKFLIFHSSIRKDFQYLTCKLIYLACKLIYLTCNFMFDV